VTAGAAPDPAQGFWPRVAGYVAVAVLLRVLLSWVNTEANDDHLAVVREILAGNWASPGREACWECYHAKLYHYSAALAYALTGLPVAPDTARVGNFVALLAGLGTIGLLLHCARRGLGATAWRPSTRLVGSACFLFWPALIVISSQATNDSFVIFFSAAALYFFHRFLEERRWRDAAGATGFMILGVSSKASGWILFLVVAALVAVKAVSEKGARRARLLGVGAVCAAAFLAAACLQEPYRGYLRDYGTPFKGALEEDGARKPLPYLFEETRYGSPGLLSIFDAFCTFRLVDMVRTPYISNQHEIFPRHRTCFWSQLYGRTFFTRFDQWPPGWQTQDAFTLNIGRICLLLGLLPAATLLTGFWLSLRDVVLGLRRRGLAHLADDNHWIFPVIALAFLGMVAMFAVLYRGYSWMKVIYLLPSLLALFKLHLDGLDHLSVRYPRFGRWNLGAHYALLFAFNLDCVRLIGHLSGRA
jgi:hypothetical protein